MTRKASRVAGSRGITSSSKNPVEKLPISKRRYVEARINGDNRTVAAAKAGIGKRQASNYDNSADVQAAYRSLMQAAIPAKKLVNLIKGGCEAKIPVYGSDGKKKGDRADWKTRRAYIEMAAEHAGYHENKVAAGSGNIINLTVTHIGQNANRNLRTIEASTETERTA